MAEQHIYPLSSIDQSLIRSYIRYCLCWPCSPGLEINTAIGRLHVAVERAIAHLPNLAGNVHAIPETGLKSSAQARRGRVEVRVSLREVCEFQAEVRYVDYYKLWHNCSSLSRDRMPPARLIVKALTPLPDTPKSLADSAPVFAVQANIINGGLLVALYLHHSVADIHGLGQIIRLMSSNAVPRTMNDEVLRGDAV